MRLTCALLIVLAPAIVHTQSLQPATAREGVARLFAPHFGGPGDVTVDYFGQLLAQVIDTVPPGDRIPRTGRRGATVLSVDYRRIRIHTFEGLDLDSGDIASFSGGLARTPVTRVTAARVGVDVTTVSTAAAVSPGLVMSARVPFVRVHVSGMLQAIEDRGTPFEEPAAPPLRVRDSSFSGLGDISTAVRWRFFSRERVQLSGIGGIRWPTGDRENLIGTGEAVPEAGVVASVTGADALTVDVAVSFANGHGTKMSEFSALPFSGPIVTSARPLDTWTYGTAARWTPHPRVSVNGDVVMTAPVTAGRGLQPGVTPQVGLQLGR